MRNSFPYPEPSHGPNCGSALCRDDCQYRNRPGKCGECLVMQTLHEFHYGRSYPQGSLLEDNDGSIYGVTSDAGAHSLGAVYRMTHEGPLTTLISFDFDTGGSPYLQGLIRVALSWNSFPGDTYRVEYKPTL